MALPRPFACALTVMLLAVAPAVAETPVEAARTLLRAWHEDPVRLDRARALLETAAIADPAPATLIELSRTWFLVGGFRARSDGEKLLAYERGTASAKRAVAAAPRDEQAHLWFAINTGRWLETKGVLRAAAMLSTIREESETVLRLNPSSVDGLILAGALAAGIPGFLGGDRAKAEMHLKRAVEIDPHHTGARLQLAQLYSMARRWPEARRELTRVLDEPTPTDLPYWAMSDARRARALLVEIGERGAPAGASGAMQSP
ncbi:MAG: hypothetical protein DMD81_27740 [Candidatus Rokuibacteriota bacterium]|nr:MAG: hypothetical protein DMD81_27740 [Candidatus Rokubacteria bacterium]